MTGALTPGSVEGVLSQQRGGAQRREYDVNRIPRF